MNLPSMKIEKKQLATLEKLCNAVGVSGDEGEIRQIIFKELESVADEIRIDAMGNLLVHKKARNANHPLKVMLDAHMDEVGFMIVEDCGDGLYSFEIIGGVDERQLPGKPVWVGKDHLPGVIGAKPIHLMSPDEFSHSIPLSELKIDLGPDGAGKAKIGDYATFATPFMQSGPSLFAKALDDRIGVATLIELVKNAPENIELFASFSVQEEVGLRGAKTAAFAFDPDLAIAIDSTPAFDLPREDGEENAVYNCRLDAGPAIYLADRGTISDPRLIRFLRETAEESKIPYQLRQPGGGGTNAGSIHRVGKGIPSVSISVPGRYAHTAILLSRIADWENTLKLLCAVLYKISPAILEKDRD